MGEPTKVKGHLVEGYEMPLKRSQTLLHRAHLKAIHDCIDIQLRPSFRDMQSKGLHRARLKAIGVRGQRGNI